MAERRHGDATGMSRGGADRKQGHSTVCCKLRCGGRLGRCAALVWAWRHKLNERGEVGQPRLGEQPAAMHRGDAKRWLETE